MNASIARPPMERLERMNAARRIAALLLSFLASPLGAAVLYKSVGPTGVLEFSDRPPESGRLIERIELSESSSSSNPLDTTIGPPRDERMRLLDGAVARANAELDLAEHALAVARRPVWSEPEPTRLASTHAARTDMERIDFYKRKVKEARQALMQALKTQRSESPTFTARLEPPGDHR